MDGKRKGGKDGLKSVADFTKDFKLDEGLFNLYQDTAKGSMFIHVPAEAMDDEFIYFSQVEDGVVSSGFFRGSYRGSKVITFHRHFGQLEVHAENTNFHVDPDNALIKAADANLNTPILASLKVEAEDSTGVIVSADAMFLKEELQMVKPPSVQDASRAGQAQQDEEQGGRRRQLPHEHGIVCRLCVRQRQPDRGWASIRRWPLRHRGVPPRLVAHA